MLAEKGVKPWEQAQLTMRQKWEIYFHPRDGKGNIRIPDAELRAPEVSKPRTLEEELNALEFLQEQLSKFGPLEQSPLQIEQLKEALKAKFAGGEGGDGAT